MVLGAGSTSILESNNSLVRLDEHRRNLTKVRAELENIAQYGGTQVLWALEAPVDWERLNGTRRGRGLTNEALGRYNSEANKVRSWTVYVPHHYITIMIRCSMRAGSRCGAACTAWPRAAWGAAGTASTCQTSPPARSWSQAKTV